MSGTYGSDMGFSACVLRPFWADVEYAYNTGLHPVLVYDALSGLLGVFALKIYNLALKGRNMLTMGAAHLDK